MSSDGDSKPPQMRRAQRYLNKLAKMADTLRITSNLNDPTQARAAPKYRRTPQEIVELVRAWSDANEDASFNDDIALLVSLCKEDAQRIEEGDDDDDDDEMVILTPSKMRIYMVLLDRIFFFGILTRRVPIDKRIMDDAELVELRTYNTPSFGKLVNWDASQMLISLRTQVYELEKSGSGSAGRENGNGNEDEDEDEEDGPKAYQAWDRYLDEVLSDLVEGMCLAFLDLFCDHNNKQYMDQLMPGKGFGQGWMYWELVRYVMLRMADWLPDPMNEFFTKKADDATKRGEAICNLQDDLLKRERRHYFSEDYDDIMDESYASPPSEDDDSEKSSSDSDGSDDDRSDRDGSDDDGSDDDGSEDDESDDDDMLSI